MQEMTTQLVTAVSLTTENGLEKDRQYLFSLQVYYRKKIEQLKTDKLFLLFYYIQQ